MKLRKIENVYDPMPTSDGAGVKLLRAIGQPALGVFDPFLLLDEFRSDNADDYIGGFPSHPHRGFETVTYMLAGLMHHKDSTGAEGDLTPGAVQWMTAGRGVIHSEMPRQKEGLIRGFQLWVNLPADKKMSAPRYQNIPPEEIPMVTRKDGTSIKVIAGEVDGSIGPVEGIAVEPIYLDVTLPPGAVFSFPVPEGHNAFVYILDGDVTFGDRKVSEAKLATFGLGDETEATGGADGGRFLLVAGRPLDEPIARGGPFVMNTREEINQAISDYQNGRF
jgi:redox-sensitive bicupin YhaK (pirin superfamily)